MWCRLLLTYGAALRSHVTPLRFGDPPHSWGHEAMILRSALGTRLGLSSCMGAMGLFPVKQSKCGVCPVQAPPSPEGVRSGGAVMEKKTNSECPIRPTMAAGG